MTKDKADKIKSKNLKIAGVIATLMVTSAVGLMQLNKDHLKVATIGDEDVYISKYVSFEDKDAWFEAINSEIVWEVERYNEAHYIICSLRIKHKDCYSISVDDVIFRNGVRDENDFITKINQRYYNRETIEIEDLKERKKFDLAKKILMKKVEEKDISYLLEIQTL